MGIVRITEEDVKKKVMSMYTDPDHIKVSDPGKIEGNCVFTYLDAFCKPEHFEKYLPEYENLDALKAHYQRGGLGDVKVKRFLNSVMQEELAPIRERRLEWQAKLPEVVKILEEGTKKAYATAEKTLDEVKSNMKINYFKDNLVYLYILSIILGGTIYLLNDTVTLSNKGYIFENNGLKINLYLLLLISPIVIIKYINKQKHYQTEYQNYYNIKIYYNDKVIKDTAFLDTGNNLKDPYFHKPIILVNSSLIQEHIKTFLVPYYTVNNKDLLEVFSPQKILVNNKKTKKALIGLSDVNINGIKIILNKEILWES